MVEHYFLSFAFEWLGLAVGVRMGGSKINFLGHFNGLMGVVMKLRQIFGATTAMV